MNEAAQQEMTLTMLLVGIAILLTIITGILFVVFGQVTVRKLRKKPETKDYLGLELTSGWDILNVASAICRPRWLNEKYKSAGYFVSASSERLIENTTPFDRALARVFWYTYVFTGSGIIITVMLNFVGIID